uniref:Uncharacterized protein n=1 Tax=Helianthus annuus TaxID=4232 RepID=A0A251RSR4_HELAN
METLEALKSSTFSHLHLYFSSKIEISGRLWKNMFVLLSRIQAFEMLSFFSYLVVWNCFKF